MANVETAFTRESSFSLDSRHMGTLESGVDVLRAGESFRVSGEQSSFSGGEGGLPSAGHGLGPQMQAGRSCRGCLYFSRSRQDSGRDPLCVGITSAESVPAAVFSKHRQMREQEALEDNPGPRPVPHSPHSQVPQQDQQSRQQQKMSNFERQQKILEDFRYACIGYSVYPTPPSQPSSASSSSSSSSRPALPPSQSGPKQSSSSRLPPPSSISFLIPAGAGTSMVLPVMPELSGNSILEPRVSTQGDGVGLASLLRAEGSSTTTGPGSSCPASSAGTGGGSVPGGGLAEESIQHKNPASPPPLLPICVGIEILAGTKSPDKRDVAQQPNPQPLPQQRETLPAPVAGIQPGVDPTRPEADKENTQPAADRLPSWANRSSSASPKSPPVGGPGITAEEFSRRYMRSARLITKKCISNFERIKGAVHSTVQDIFKGDK